MSMFGDISRYAAHPRADIMLLGASVAESVAVPVLPDELLIPMVVVNRRRAFYYAGIATLGSVVGGIFGYFLGIFMLQAVGIHILEFYELGDEFTFIREWMGDYTPYILGAAGFAPLPFFIFTWLFGMLHVNFVLFLPAMILARAARFFLVSWLLWRGGVSYKSWIERQFFPLALAATVVMIFGVIFFKLISGN